MHQNQTQLLKNTPLFGGIRPDIIQSMLTHSKEITKIKNQFFFNEGDLANSMFILVEGHVEIQKTWKNKSYPINRLLAGDCFGEMAIIDHCTRSASVIALDKCRAIELNIECFNAVYTVDIKQYTMLQMNMGREVSRRLRHANDLLFQNKVEKDIKNRVYQHSI